MVDERVFQAARDVAGGLERRRIAQRDVVLRARELFGRHRLQDRVQLVEELGQRLRRLVGLHAGGGEERSRTKAHVEPRARAVRVAVHLAQVVVQPGCERPAEDCVHHDDREVVGRRARDADRSDPDLRLRRARLVHQIDLALGRRFLGRQLFRGGAAGRLPRSKRLLEQRDERGRAEIADGQQRRAVRAERRCVEAAEIVAGERLDRLGGAHLRRAVAMALAVEDAREGDRGDRRRIVAPLQQAREPLLALPLELVFRERRAQRHVGHDRQRVGKPRHWHVQADGGCVDSARRAEIGAEEIDGVGDLERRSRARALLEHRGREARDAVLPGWIVRGAAEDDEVHLRDRNFVILDDPHRQAVGQLLLLNRWQTQRRRRAGLRRTGPIRRLLRGERAARERRDEQDQPSSHRSISSPVLRSARRERRAAGTARRPR